MAGRKRNDVDNELYERFASWNRERREIALRVLTAIHAVVPDKPAEQPEQPALIQE